MKRNHVNNSLTTLLGLLCLCSAVFAQNKNGSDAGVGPGSFTENGTWIPQGAEAMDGLKMGPFVNLPGGGILTIDGHQCFISSDEGLHWQAYPIFADSMKYDIRPERALIRTSSGVIILAFANDKERANWNWNPGISDSPGAILPTYTVRSLDGGKTWEEPQKLHDEWTGAIRDIIETTDGNIVFTTMMMRHSPGHHTVLTYTSKDHGKSWLRSNVIDLGGVGHHSGVTESTLVQLKDGRLWMLMRTNWGTFWEVYSNDDGLKWDDVKTTTIDASASPGLLKRLASGRLVLIWNRRNPEGQHSYPLVGGDLQWSETPASVHREELSIAFSEDDGKSWSKPVVIAKCTPKMKYMNLPGGAKDLSYPYALEAKPGELWITTWRGGLRLKLKEADFVR